MHLRRGHLISKTSHRSIEMTYEHRLQGTFSNSNISRAHCKHFY